MAKNKPICSIDGCGKPSLANKMCDTHYRRNKRRGSPHIGPAVKPGDRLRWVLEVALKFDGTECLLFPSKSSQGYGLITVDGKQQRAHRYICQQVHGEAPPDRFHAAHRCGNPNCCNPRHLRWATPKENAADKNDHGTSPVGERHGCAKLTDAQVAEVREIAKTWKGLKRDLAIEYGLSPNHLYKILRGVVRA